MKASPKSRRRGKKAVEEVLGAEPGLDQVPEAKIPPRRSSGKGRKKKVLEAEDLAENQKEVHSDVFYMTVFMISEFSYYDGSLGTDLQISKLTLDLVSHSLVFAKKHE